MLAVTTDDLNAVFRSEVDDLIRDGAADPVDEDRLWKDAEIYTYMTEAADATARATLGLFKILQIPFVIGQQSYKLPAYVLDVHFGHTLTSGNELRPFDIGGRPPRDNCDDYGNPFAGEYGSQGIFAATGDPRRYMRDYDQQAIRFIPIPAQVDTAELQCSVTIQAPLTAGLPMPFIMVPDQRLMLLKMKELAYNKRDVDTYDPSKRDGFAEEFEAKGLKRNLELQRTRRSGGNTVRFQW